MQRNDLEKEIPEINWIHDPNLRENTATLLCKAMNMGNWDAENINSSPVTLLRETDITSIEHLRDVCIVCHQLYPMVKKYCERHGVEFDYDVVICGALLHDVGKYPEVVAGENGCPRYSAQAKLMRHPLMGAILAAEEGLPEKIVHIIATHSFEGERSFHTAESQFVRSVDDLVFRMSVFGIPSKSSL